METVRGGAGQHLVGSSRRSLVYSSTLLLAAARKDTASGKANRSDVTQSRRAVEVQLALPAPHYFEELHHFEHQRSRYFTDLYGTTHPVTEGTSLKEKRERRNMVGQRERMRIYRKQIHCGTVNYGGSKRT